SSKTVSNINPILAQLDRSLNTSEEEFDPILEFDHVFETFGKKDQSRLKRITYTAVANTYEDVLKSKVKIRQAGLREKDIRWLKLVQELHEDS
ncbi:MAG: hypothetical protein AAF492_31115, partial [Verrucomicrobiota bacterium]